MGEITVLDRILHWSSYLTAEEQLHYRVINVDLNKLYYYWTPEFKRFAEGLVNDAASLIWLVGLQGSGKTSALRALEVYLSGRGGAYLWRWGVGLPDSGEHLHSRFLLVDLPDYGAGSSARLNKDLDGIGRFWYGMRYGEGIARRHLVVAVQREMFRGHYLFGKGEVFNLRTLSPGELTGFYLRMFDYCYPFTGESLRLVALRSRGIFRRFMRYVRLCVRDMQGRGVDSIGVDDVRRVINLEVISMDMDLELSGSLRGSEKVYAVAVVSALMEGGEVNQRELALRVGVGEAVMSRLLGRLEGLGYVRRVRGDRKELRVSLVNDE